MQKTRCTATKGVNIYYLIIDKISKQNSRNSDGHLYKCKILLSLVLGSRDLRRHILGQFRVTINCSYIIVLPTVNSLN